MDQVSAAASAQGHHADKNGNGRYFGREKGLGYASGPAYFTLKGTFRIDYVTRNGSATGFYEVRFSDDGKTASGIVGELNDPKHFTHTNWTRISNLSAPAKTRHKTRLPWTGIYRYNLNDRQGFIVVTLKLTQRGNKLTGTIRAKTVSKNNREENFDFSKSITGVCSGNKGKIKMEGQPYDKVVLFENGHKLAIYDAEGNEKYVLLRIR